MTLSDFTLLSTWLLSCFFFFFYCTDITEGNYSNSCMCSCRLYLSVCGWLRFTVDLLVIAYIAFAWLCQIKSSVLVGKCYKSSQQISIYHHTPGHQYCSFYVFHCHCKILIVPVCMFFFFFIPQLFSICSQTKFLLFVFDSSTLRVLY